MTEELVDRPESWPVHSSRVLHADAWVVSVVEDEVSRPDHPEETFGRIAVHHPGAVMVLAIDDDDRVFLMRQYRHTSRHVFVEIPAGVRDSEGEPSLETARRELREEAELAASDWRLLLSTYPSAGILSETHDIFLARGLSHAPRGDFALEHEEAEMETFWAPFDDLLEAVLRGEVTEGPLVQAVLAYEVLRRRGDL